ncbi:hypothetical protein HALLA_13255 [Halostagnicola larsenii XH-48]|uniref:Uncharacterized protein n=1 Tax=Halostagnicola larsenii XH-48 TaxID=797299 RepID=W0JUS3_9EURY|nr:hypothetical protein HALLA_13255 [Halostagnicola larsenii XH-48]
MTGDIQLTNQSVKNLREFESIGISSPQWIERVLRGVIEQFEY